MIAKGSRFSVNGIGKSTQRVVERCFLIKTLTLLYSVDMCGIWASNSSKSANDLFKIERNSSFKADGLSNNWFLSL